MMRHIDVRDRLDDYFDGALPAPEREAVADHLEACAECRGELEGMAALQAETRALPRGIAPPRDLWPGVAARLGGRGAAEPAGAAEKVAIEVDFRRAVGMRRALLAAAAVALVALSSGATALLMSRGGGAAPLAVTSGPSGVRSNSALAAFRPTEVEYLGTVERLEAELEARRGALAPQTVAVIEENLRIIDRAIAEARTALEEDPANADLPLLLSGVYRRKVELLQSAIRIPMRSL